MKWHIVTFVNVEVSLAVVLSVVWIAYSKSFHVFQCVWIFVQAEGTKDIVVVNVPPMLPLSRLVSGENVAIWNFGLTWSLSNKLLKHFESKYDAYLYIFWWTFIANIKVSAPLPFDSTEFFFQNKFTLTPRSSVPPSPGNTFLVIQLMLIS